VHAHIPFLPIERLRGFNAHGKHTGEYIFSPDQDGLGEMRAKPKSKPRAKGKAGADDDEFWKVETSEEGLELLLGGGRVAGLDSSWGRRDGKVLRDTIIQGNFEVSSRSNEGRSVRAPTDACDATSFLLSLSLSLLLFLGTDCSSKLHRGFGRSGS